MDKKSVAIVCLIVFVIIQLTRTPNAEQQEYYEKYSHEKIEQLERDASEYIFKKESLEKLEKRLKDKEKLLSRQEKELSCESTSQESISFDSSKPHELFLTKDGRTVQEVMDHISIQTKSKWPARIDLIVRTGSRDAGLLPYLFKSIDLFWPKGIGKIIVILDKDEEYLVRGVIPTYCEIYFETFLPGIPGRLGNQWSNFWADNYTDPDTDFVAVIDSDCVFQTKITPDILFYEGSDKLIVIGHPTIQTELYKPGNDWWLGLGDAGWHGNFMWTLPFIYPRWMLPEFRKFVASKHPELGYFDNCMIEWAKKEEWNFFSQFTLLGNFMYHFHEEKFHFAMEDRSEPALRIASHVFVSPMYQHEEKGPPSPPKVTDKYVNASLKLINEGLCFSIPPGELSIGCERYEGKTQEALWHYVWFNTWGSSWTRYSPTAVYEKHFNYLWSLYPKSKT